jgi:glycosyltransferase involved in cell wall biosynthesis
MAGVQTPAIACVAGLHGRKAVDDLIRAADMLMREHPKVHFYIAGSGPDAPSLKEQARATCAPERIVFVGHLPDPRALLQACDIFALASLSDPFPLVILEALEEGCAVVATDVDGIPEALDFGQSGVLVPPRAPAELYKALSRILAAPAELARLKAAALTRSKAFSVARMAAQYVDIYRELLAR